MTRLSIDGNAGSERILERMAFAGWQFLLL